MKVFAMTKNSSLMSVVLITLLALVVGACGGTATTTTSAAATATSGAVATTAATATTVATETTAAPAEDGPLEPLASGFPDGPITLWAAFPAGHPDDLLNRTVAEIASDYSPVRLVADTHEAGPGIAYAFVNDLLPTLPRAEEGYHLYVANWAGMALRPYTIEAISQFNIDFLQPLGNLYTIPFAYAVLNDSPYQSLEEVVQFAKDNPGQLRYASGQPGSRGQLQAQVFAEEAGIEMTFVPTDGVGESSALVQGGGAELFPSGLHSIDLDVFRVLAVTGSERVEVAPDAPTMEELGYTNVLQLMDSYAESGYGALPEVPEENKQWLIELLTKVVNDPRLQEAYPYATIELLPPETIRANQEALLDELFPILEELELNVRDR